MRSSLTPFRPSWSHTTGSMPLTGNTRRTNLTHANPHLGPFPYSQTVTTTFSSQTISHSARSAILGNCHFAFLGNHCLTCRRNKFEKYCRCCDLDDSLGCVLEIPVTRGTEWLIPGEFQAVVELVAEFQSKTILGFGTQSGSGPAKSTGRCGLLLNRKCQAYFKDLAVFRFFSWLFWQVRIPKIVVLVASNCSQIDLTFFGNRRM